MVQIEHHLRPFSNAKLGREKQGWKGKRREFQDQFWRLFWKRPRFWCNSNPESRTAISRIPLRLPLDSANRHDKSAALWNHSEQTLNAFQTRLEIRHSRKEEGDRPWGDWSQKERRWARNFWQWKLRGGKSKGRPCSYKSGHQEEADGRHYRAGWSQEEGRLSLMECVTN